MFSSFQKLHYWSFEVPRNRSCEAQANVLVCGWSRHRPITRNHEEQNVTIDKQDMDLGTLAIELSRELIRHIHSDESCSSHVLTDAK